MSTLIRQATEADLPVVKEIINLSFPRFFRLFAAHSLDSEGVILVNVVDGRIVGFAKLIDFMVEGVKYGCVLWLAVHPSFRLKGYAADLVNAGTRYLKDNGSRAVFASIQHNNVGSLGTFLRVGYVRVGFLGLWRMFGWRVFVFYRDIWYFLGEVVVVCG